MLRRFQYTELLERFNQEPMFRNGKNGNNGQSENSQYTVSEVSTVSEHRSQIYDFIKNNLNCSFEQILETSGLNENELQKELDYAKEKGDIGEPHPNKFVVWE